MESFVRLTGIAAPLYAANIDTDALVPSREMTGTGKAGYGEKLFSHWRYLSGRPGERVENPDFVLNQPPYREAVFLIAGPNFGSGSSRESAVWAIRQFGFRAVIAPSFGAIFRNNCFRNGVLPVVLDTVAVEALAARAESEALALTVDLERRVVEVPAGEPLAFQVPDGERRMLLEGLDAIRLTLKHRDAIAAFQERDRRARPWIWSAPNTPR